MQKITPFIWLHADLKEAVAYYQSVFPSAIMLASSAGPDDSFSSVTLRIEDHEYILFNGGPMFTINEAFSLFVLCESQEEIDDKWEKFIAGGGKPSRCGWLKDKYGVSWQLVPTLLGKLLGDPDREKANRVMQAMLKMDKLIIADLEKAAGDGD